MKNLKSFWRITFCLLILMLSFSFHLIHNNTQAAPLGFNGTLQLQNVYTGFGGNFIYPNQLIGVTIVDTDPNVNTNFGPGNDQIVAEFQYRINAGAWAAYPVPILESAVTPGTFTRTINPRADVAMNINDVIQFRYQDNTHSVSNPFFVLPTQTSISMLATNAVVTVNPTSGALGSSFTVTVVDPDRNLTAGNDANLVVIGVRNLTDASPTALYTNLTPTQVTEVAPGTFQVVVNNANPNPDWDAVPGNTISGEQLQIIYDDQFRADGGAMVGVTALYNIGGTNGTITMTPNPVSPNGTVTITVTDTDLNTNGAVAETTNVAVFHTDGVNSIGGIVLTETGVNTGVFTGTFNLNSFNPTPAGVLTTTAPNNFIFARYVDVQNTEGAVPVNRNSANVIVANVVGTIDAPSAYLDTAGYPLVVRVVDPDRNTTNAADTLNILVYRTVGCTDPAPIPNTCTKPVIATETGPQTGIFEFSYLNFANLNATWTPDDEAVEAEDIFQFVYDDTTNPVGGTVRLTDNTIITGEGDGRVVITPSIVAPNGVVEVCVFDADRNMVPGAPNTPQESVQINLGNATKGIVPGPVFTLFETTNEGVFCNQISISNPTWGLNPAIGDQLVARYLDPFPTGGGPAKLITGTALVGLTGNVATMSCTNTIPGRPIEVTVNDPDRTGDGSLTAVGQNITLGGTSETVTLTNIGGGVFKGTISTAYGNSPDGLVDGILEARGGDTIRYTYNDQFNTTGVPANVTTECRVIDRRTAVNFCDRGLATTAPTWRAEYFTNKNLEGSPVVIADEVHLSVNWEETSPYREIPSDNWSARWTTTVRVVDAGKYRFRIGVDDGARFYVDNQLFLDQWSNGAFRTFFVDVTLQPGDHTFRVEYFDDQFLAGITVDCQFGQAPVAAIDSEGNTVDVIPEDVNFEEAVAHITTGRINVRANPTIEAPRIAYVYIYERYPILGVTDDNGWYLIQLRNGQTGWVARLYVRRYEQNPVQIYPSWSGSQAALPNVEVAGYAKVELNVRNIPRGDIVVTILPPGATFRILARTQSGAWVKISYDGLEGWVHNLPEYVGFSNGSIRDLPREG